MEAPDLRQTSAVLVVFAMNGCGPCEHYLPRLSARIEAFIASGAAFHVWSPGEAITPGTIPVLFYDAASKDNQLQDLADRLQVSATPTTCLMTRAGLYKQEGSLPDDKIDELLLAAHNANR